MKKQLPSCLIGKRTLIGLVALAFLLPVDESSAVQLDLTTATSGFIGSAFFTRDATHTAGTGVVDPFLTIQNKGIEQGYNTSGGLVLDTTRPAWNRDLRFSELATINLAGVNYFKFTLDANEPGNDKALLSIDNIRIYTSPTGSQTTSNPDSLGTLRYALNNPLANSGNYVIDNWVSIDSRISGGPGSGHGDMAVYIPTSLFAGVNQDDFVYFYNLNGVHGSADTDMIAESGFEEWWATTGRSPDQSVPDAGGTMALLGIAIGSFSLLRRKLGAQ